MGLMVWFFPNDFNLTKGAPSPGSYSASVMGEREKHRGMKVGKNQAKIGGWRSMRSDADNYAQIWNDGIFDGIPV